MKKPSTEIAILQDIIDKQTLAEQLDMRNIEFDKIMKYLEFQRLPGWKKAAIYASKGLGLIFALVFILALLGVGYLAQ